MKLKLLRDLANLKRNGFRAVFLTALALCICNLPASATIIFSDLGPAGNVYNTGSAQTVCGAGGCGSMEIANLFTAAVSSNVTRIDVAVANFTGFLTTFNAAIFSVNGSNQPGTKLGEWDNLTAPDVSAGCCGLVSIPITGLALSGLKQYFFVVSPVSLDDGSFNMWFDNTQGQSGTVLSSPDGNSWSYANSSATNTLSAFEVVANPEPASVLLFGTGLIAILCARRQRRNR
jgi:hypothetical protein